MHGTGAGDLAYQSWRYLSGTQTPPGGGLANTSFDVTMPATPGTYNLRLFQNNGSTRLATSATVTVQAATIGVDTTVVAVLGLVTVTVADGPGFVLDWVGVHGTGDPDLTYQSWRYLSGTHTPPGSGLTTATFPVTMPAEPGTYNLRCSGTTGPPCWRPVSPSPCSRAATEAMLSAQCPRPTTKCNARRRIDRLVAVDLGIERWH